MPPKRIKKEETGASKRSKKNREGKLINSLANSMLSNQKMEGKIVILSVLIMSLVMAQIHVEAFYPYTVCCPTVSARSRYSICRLTPEGCAESTGCILIYPAETACPGEYPYGFLKNSGDANEFCKLGCVSSLCGALNTLKNSDASKTKIYGTVEQCTKACSTLCIKGSKTPVESA